MKKEDYLKAKKQRESLNVSCAGAICGKCFKVLNRETPSKEHADIRMVQEKRYGQRICNDCLNGFVNKSA